jgi:uncharacterized protein (TIGR02266 family)
MADDRAPRRGGAASPPEREPQARDEDTDPQLQVDRRSSPRIPVVVPISCRYASVLDFVETQSLNISITGMFIETDTPATVGSRIQFDFSLADGFTLLAGMAEVVRVVEGGVISGMGVRFLELAPQYRRLIERIVAVNAEEGRSSKLTFDFSRPAPVPTMPAIELPPAASVARPAAAAAAPPRVASPAPATLTTLTTGSASPPPPTAAPDTNPIRFDGRSLRLVLGPATVSAFTANPLLNVRVAGFFIPADEDVPLGTVFDVEIVDAAGATLVKGKGKVVAKQQLRVGIRLGDVAKDVLARLEAEVGKLAPRK